MKQLEMMRQLGPSHKRILRRAALNWQPGCCRHTGLPLRSSNGRAIFRTRVQSVENNSTTETGPEQRLKKTITDLDAILGITEEDQKTDKKGSSSSSKKDVAESSRVAVEVASGLLQKTAREEARRLAGSDAQKSAEMETLLSEQLSKIVEKAKKLAEDDNLDKNQGEQQLQQEYMNLINIMFQTPESLLSKDDIKKLKDKVFGPMTFWVTETSPIEADPAMKGGLLIRGNLRDSREKVFKLVCEKVKEMFGNKFEVLMMEDPEGPEEGASAPTRERVAFQIVPAAAVTPPTPPGWQIFVAGILAILLLASCANLAIVANITKLPKETLAFLSDPANTDSVLTPPGMDTWDPVPYIMSSVPIVISLFSINVTHEVGHRIAAAVRNVKLGASFFIPNLSIGSFGAVTPFRSLLRSRSELWDVAFAGPLAGVALSVALLTVGLLASKDSGTPPEMLVPVPTQLFQGSLLLGSITRLALGDAAMRSNEVLIHPLTIAGWCGLITNSLNLLPVGQLDGGRMMQAAFGKQALSLSSFFTYVGLGLGLLGSNLSLPFGLYVLICQRNAEKYIQDAVSPVGDKKQVVTAVALLAAVLILLPMAPELADTVGVGPSRML